MARDIQTKRVTVTHDVTYAVLGGKLAVYRKVSNSFGEGTLPTEIFIEEGLARLEDIQYFCEGGASELKKLKGYQLVAKEYPALLQAHGRGQADRLMLVRGLSHPDPSRIYTELIDNEYPLSHLVRFEHFDYVFNAYGHPLPQVYHCNMVTGIRAVHRKPSLDFDARLSDFDGRKITDWKKLVEMLQAHPQVTYVRAEEAEDDYGDDDYFLFAPTAEQERALWEKQQSYEEAGAWLDKGRAIFDLDLLGLVEHGVLVSKR